MKTIILGVKGSATSGNRMHAGRPGKVGGSMARNYGLAVSVANAMSSHPIQPPGWSSSPINPNNGFDMTTLNRIGLQAYIDLSVMKIDVFQAEAIVQSPAAQKASGTYTSAAATAARAAAGPTSDLTEDIDWTTTGLAVPNRNTPGTPWVSNAEDAWILGIDKTNQAGKQAIADYTAGYITKETLHERLSPAYRDMNLGFAIPGIENTARDQGKTDFNDLFAAKINGAAQRRSFTKDEAWVSQIKLSELNDNQWKAFSEYKRGLITLDDLRKTVAPHTLLPVATPKAPPIPKVVKAPNDKTQPARYNDPDDLPSMKGFSNGSLYVSGSAKNGGDGYLDAIVKDQGFDGKPQVITRAQFDAAVVAGEVAIYRGTSSSAASRVQRYKDFRTGEYYSGFGMYGNGTYTSTLQRTARSYDGGEYDQSSRILAMTIKPDAKIIEYGDASMQKDQYVAKLTRNSMIDDSDHSIGRWAAAAGYDAIRVPNADRNNGDFYIILNRTAVRVVNVDFKPDDDPTF